MSNSVFKEHPSAEGDNGELKTDSNLFVFINKNGSVSVDNAALQDLLVTDAVESKTSVTVLRVESPTPSVELEIEEEERIRKELEEAEHSKDYGDNENDGENEDDDDNEKENDETNENNSSSLKKTDDIIKHVSVTIENFYLPEEAKQLASDILSLAGKTNPLQISVDFEHQLNVIANDHCYTPFKSPSQRKKSDLSAAASQVNSPNQRRESPAGIRSNKSKFLKNSSTTAGSNNNQSTNSTERSGVDKTATKKVTSTAAADDASANEDDDKLSGEEDDENSATDSSYFSPTESDNDRDSDLDFNVNDRPSRVRKLPNRTKKQKQQQKLLKSKKRQNLSGESSSLQDTSNADDHPSGTTTTTTTTSTTSKKRPLKNVKRSTATTSTPLTNKTTKSTHKSTNKLAKSSEFDSLKEEAASSKNSAASSVSLDATKESEKQSAQQSTIQSQPKKDKKPPAHVEALYSDMSSLFSTPDIIKKVNQTSTATTTTTTTVGESIPAATTTAVNVTAPTNKSYLIPQSTAQLSKTLPADATAMKQPRSLASDLATEQDKQLELIDSIVQQELKEESPTKTTSMNDDIPKIVKMLELPSEHSNVIGNFTSPAAPSTSSSISQTIMSTNSTENGSLQYSAAIDHELLDDSDLLEGLGNPDDTGLTEDLLQHVAKLAQDKNLQEVIDKQVLGVEPNSQTPLIQSPPMIIHSQPQDQPQLVKPLETKTLVTANTSKEPIKIIRSNGRVITLPPIEAPTTRGAKRRAQNQPTPDQQQSKLNKSTTDQMTTPIESSNSISHVGAGSATKAMTTPKTSKAKEKRASIASKKQIEATMVKNEGDEGDDDEDIDEDEDSDGTYNSEDDPNRLWCICRQPHNNRFMICCDKCEEWFHGKCVNVTKAMGMEMERQGIEWVCPNCLKKLPQSSNVAAQQLVVQQKLLSQQQLDKQGNQKPSPTIQKQKQQIVQSTASAKKTKNNETVRKTPAKIVASTKTDSIANAVKSPVPSSSSAVVTTAAASSSSSSNITNVSPSVLSCIVCKKPARLGSIFCSDECISKQANVTGFGTVSAQNQKNLSTQSNDSSTKEKKPSTQVIRQKISPVNQSSVAKETKYLKSKNQRIIMVEKKTGRLWSGNNAPTDANLKQWLQAHPGFEPVAENSERAVAFKAKQQQIRLAKEMAPEKTLFSVDGQKVQTTIKIDSSKKFILVNPSKQQQQQQQMQNIVIGGNAESSTKKSIAKITKIPAQVSLKPGSPIKSPPPPLQSPTKTQQQQQSISRQTSSQQQQQQQQSQNKRKPAVRRTESSGSNTTHHNTSKSSKTEPIRVNVQRMFKEQISLRCAEECTTPNCPKLTEDEIERFARDTEAEIYHLFNKDTSNKYLSKYRSLLFNIKDRKNQTLFQKICNKSIEPKQLVRMLPEELASQQLALWRENENKHQLEMIKKSELDLLACAKSYVLKTHKGEEVIENKGSDRVTLDPSISVEDVVSVLNNSTVSSTSENLNESSIDLQLPPAVTKDNRIDSRFDKYLSVDSSSATTTTTSVIGGTKLNTTALLTTSSSSTSSSKKKETRRSRSRSRDRQKSSSSSSSSKHKRKRSRERRSRSRERDKSRSDDRSRDRDRDRDQKSKKDDRKDRDRGGKSSTTSSSTSGKHTNKDITSGGSKLTDTKEPPAKQMKKDDNSHLIDKIIEAQSTIDRILGTTTSTATPSTATKTTKTVEKSSEDTAKTLASKSISKELSVSSSPVNILVPVKKTTCSESSDQEPSSTVTIPTPPENPLIDDDQMKSDDGDGDSHQDVDDENTLIWTGTIIMPDVATFQLKIHTFDGDCMSIQKELRRELEVVGRIVPDNVWEYISKIKKTTKEVLVVRLGADSLDDRQAYYELYRCLSTRKRLGVVKSGSSLIKDFYIFPLAKHKSMPSVLLPMKSSTAIFEGDRPDLLFGIIVKFSSAAPATTSIKRSIPASSTTSTSQQSTTIKVRVAVDLPKIKSKALKLEHDQQYTPPSSPRTFVTKSSTQNVPLPVMRKEKDDLENIESDNKSDKEKDDGDEPYSPGGSDDDDIHFIMPPTVSSLPPSTPTKHNAIQTTVPISPSQMDADEITRKMDEINREIVKSQIEIAGMLLPGGSNNTASILAEPYSPTSAPITKSIPTLANISIPSNLQEILNSIKNVTTDSLSPSSSSSSSLLMGKLSSSSSLAYSKKVIDGDNVGNDDDDEEYTPAPISAPSYAPMVDYIPSKTISSDKNNSNEPSKLARLTDEELMNMVPDDMDINLPPAMKKAKYSIDEPPPPGLEDEYVP